MVLKNGPIGENRKDYFDSKKTVSVLVENDALVQDKVLESILERLIIILIHRDTNGDGCWLVR